MLLEEWMGFCQVFILFNIEPSWPAPLAGWIRFPKSWGVKYFGAPTDSVHAPRAPQSRRPTADTLFFAFEFILKNMRCRPIDL